MKQLNITLLALLLSLFALPCQLFAQEEEDDDAPSVMLTGAPAMYFFEKNPDTPGKMDAFLDINIEKITFSCRDEHGNLYDYPVRQIIYAQDTVMIKNIEDIDSIGLENKPNKYNENVFLIDDDLIPYITRVDKSTFSFWLSKDCPRHPAQDQVVYTIGYDDIIDEYSPTGRIWRIDDDGDSYRYIVDIVHYELKDIYERLVTVNSQHEYRDEEGNVLGRVMVSSAPDGDIAFDRSGPKRALKEEFLKFLKNPKVSLSEKFKKLKQTFWDDIECEGSSLLTKDGIKISYYGLMKYKPAKARDDDFEGGYFSFGIKPQVTFKLEVCTNIESIVNTKVSGVTTAEDIDYDYICTKFLVNIDIFAGLQAGYKSPHQSDDIYANAGDAVNIKKQLKEIKKYKLEYSKNMADNAWGKGKKAREKLDFLSFPIRFSWGWGLLEFDVFNPVFETWAEATITAGIDITFDFGIQADINWSKLKNQAILTGALMAWSPLLAGVTLGGSIGYAIADDALKLSVIKHELDFKPNFELEGSFDVFYGLEPSIKLGIIDPSILSIGLNGKIGGYAKGTLTLDIVNLFQGPYKYENVEDFDPDELCRDYETYGGEKNNIEAGIRTGAYAELNVLNVIDEENFLASWLNASYPISLSTFFDHDLMASKNTPPGMIIEAEDELNKDYAILRASLTPIITKAPKVSNTPTGFKVEYKEELGLHVITPYFGVAIVDLSDPAPRKRKYFWKNEISKSYLSEVHSFYIPGENMEVGKTYAIYPVYWSSFHNLKPWEYTPEVLADDELQEDFDSRVIFMSPYAKWLATPKFVEGEVESIENSEEDIYEFECEKYEYKIVNWEAGDYTNTEHKIGFAVIDAGRLTDGEQYVEMAQQDKKNVKFYPIEDYICQSITEGKYNNQDPDPANHYPAIKLDELEEGHRYYYAMYFDANLDDDEMDYFTDTKSFVTKGDGMTLKSLPPLTYGHDYIDTRGVLTWFNEAPLDKLKLDVALVIYQKGHETEQQTYHFNSSTISNNNIFEFRVDGLKENMTYCYNFLVSYGGELKAVSEMQTVKTDRNAAKDIPTVRKLDARLISASSCSATFEMMADWDSSDDDVVEIGIIYYRNMPNVPKEGDLFYPNIGTRLFPQLIKKKKDWNDGVEYACWKNPNNKNDKNYASMRGKTVTVQLTNLYPHNPKYKDREYFYRPYFKLSNSATLSKNMSESQDNYDAAMLITDKSGNVIRQDIFVHEKMHTFSTDPGNSKAEVLRVEPPQFVGGSWIWPVQNRGSFDLRETGIVYSNAGKQLVRDTQGVNTLVGKKTAPKEKTMAKIQSMRRAAEEDAEDPDDDEYTPDDYNEYYEVSDLSPLIKNETYKMRTFYETEDGRIIYSDEFEMTYANDNGGDAVNFRFIDLGLSVDWAEANVGATTSTDFGNYYTWGETSTKGEYTEDNYTTPPVDNIAGYEDYDVATASYGIECSIPTKAQWDELKEKCSWQWTTIAGVCGYQVTGPNGNSIFLPAAGNKYGDRLYSGGEGGCYWTSETSVVDVEADVTAATDADRFHFNLTEEPDREPGRKYYGRSIRAVRTK